MSRFVLFLLALLVITGCAGLELERTTTATAEKAIDTTLATTSSTSSTTTTTLPPTVVEGRVVDINGSPVSGVRVVIGDLETHTIRDGSFEIEAEPPGAMTVSKPGWKGQEVEWTLPGEPIIVQLEAAKIRGLRISADAAGDDAVFAKLLELAEATAINAFVFDTKQEGGLVRYDTSVSEAYEIGAVDSVYEPAARIAQAHYHEIYAITRIVVFEDRFRAEGFPDEKLVGGWVDPQAESAWDYNIDLAVEACELGFDEIQFDYIRYPSGQTVHVSGQLDLTEEQRVSAIEGFLERARSRLQPLGCSTSADIFAIVVSVQNDQGLGQKPEELSRHLDAVSPMMYPSHYALGWLGFPDPNDFPYEVTANSIDDALPRLEPGTALRPWLQAFWWTNDQIRTSIQAAEDRDVGWILWNVRSNFDAAALPTDDEVTD